MRNSGKRRFIAFAQFQFFPIVLNFSIVIQCFGEINVKDDTEVKHNWEELKLREGNKSTLSGVPSFAPALIKANRIQEKVRAVVSTGTILRKSGIKWFEELKELKVEIEINNQDRLEAEFVTLFSVVNAARLYNVDPETATWKN